MEEKGGLRQRIERIFSDSETKEKIALDILDKVEEGFEEGVLSRREMKMIFNVFGYMDTDAKEIMTHRKNIVALDGKSTLSDALNFILEEKYSRFPVYDEDIDSIVGVIHMRDAMRGYLDEAKRNVPIMELKDYIMPVTFIPETRSIDKLFLQMQKEKYHISIVIDEYGQTAGVVTMEDIIEEIVGNIQDEYDEEEEMILKQADGTYIVDGMTQLEDLEELLGIDFEEDAYDTINGYLVDCLDRIPSEEEECEIRFGGYVFRVMSVDNNTIRKIHIEKK